MRNENVKARYLRTPRPACATCRVKITEGDACVEFDQGSGYSPVYLCESCVELASKTIVINRPRPVVSEVFSKAAT